MDDDIFVAEALVALADRAPMEPSGLTGAIERRFVRRRRRRWTAATLTAVIVVGLTIAVPALGLRGGSPAWRLATPGAVPPPIDQVWPGTVIVRPTEPLDGYAPIVIMPIDPTHLLISVDGLSRTGITDPEHAPPVPVAVYDTVQQTYHDVTSIPQGLSYEIDALAVSDHWLVWAKRADHDDGSEIYKAPLAGGPATLLGTVDLVHGGAGLYATDTDIYWTASAPNYGVMRQPLGGGPAEPVPGAEGMSLLYPRSPWAALVTTNGRRSGQLHPGEDLYVTHELRNVVTGQDIKVRMPPRTTSLQCTPQLCVGNAATRSETGAFIQRPDGADRSPLPLGKGDPVMAYPAAGRTLLLVLHSGADGETSSCVVLDPTTGRAASIPAVAGTSFVFDFGAGTLASGMTDPGLPRPLYYLGGVR